MSLSRLSPRSSATNVARRKPSGRPDTDRLAHLRLWEAIRRTREEIERGQQRIEQVSVHFNRLIVPREEKLTGSVAKLTQRLIDHFSDGALDNADRSLLGLWITENLQALQGHPFAPGAIVNQLILDWRSLISLEGSVENQLSKLSRQMMDTLESTPGQSGAHSQASRESDNDNADKVSDSTNQSQAKSKDSRAPAEETARTHAGQNANEQQKPPPDAEPQTGRPAESIDDRIASLSDKLSVDRLFRQLAKALHPDREPDETRRQQKHVLMSQCLQARKAGDIDTLLKLYCEHIGELPDELNDDSHQELIRALQTQLSQCQAELREQRFGNRLQNLVVERYASSDPEKTVQMLDEHARSLDDEIDAMRRLYRQIRTRAGLIDSLDERRAIEQDRLSINELTGVSPGY